MKLILGEVVSILLIGFAIGCVGSYLYFMDFLEGAEETHTPIQIKDNLYTIEPIEQVGVMATVNVNLSDLNLSNIMINTE